MRKTLLLAVLMPLAAVASEPADTTIIMNNRQIVVNDSAGITRVSVYDNDGTQLTRTYETSFTDGQEVERVYVTSPFIPQTLGKNRKPMESHYPFFFMGYNLLSDGAMGFSGSTALHTRDSKSWEFGFTLASVAFRLGRNLALTTAMQTTWAYNHFQGNYVLTTTDGMSSLVEKEDIKVKKSYISYSIIRVPVMMEWSRKSFYAGFGASIDMRMSDESKYRANKKTHTDGGHQSQSVGSQPRDASGLRLPDDIRTCGAHPSPENESRAEVLFSVVRYGIAHLKANAGRTVFTTCLPRIVYMHGVNGL